MDPQLDPPHVDARIAELAERQHGVVDTQQLVGLGLTRPAIQSRKRRGSLHAVHRGVYAVGHSRLSYDGRCVAALRAYGSRAVLSHVTAASRWDLHRSSSRRIHVSVAGRADVIERDGTALHRPRSIYASEVDTVDGMRVTSVARTLLDLSGMLARGPLERAVERSLFLQLFDLDAVTTVMGRHRGCNGIATLRAILADVHHEPRLSRSDLEDFFIDLCVAHSLPRPAVNEIVERFEVDFFWREQRLIIETDGRETHLTPAAFERDRERDARLTVAGYRVVRFTHRQIVHEPDQVARTLVALLAEA